MHQLYMPWVLLFLINLSGCIYIPPLSNWDPKDLDPITVGTTRKDEVLQILGEPDELNKGRFFIYRKLVDDRGGLIFFGYGIAGFDLGGKTHLMLLEFDEDNILKRLQIEKVDRSRREIVPEEKNYPGYSWQVINLLGPDASNPFNSIACSPDGRWVAAGNKKSRVWLWDLSSGQNPEILSFKHKNMLGWTARYVPALEFSPDSQLLGAGGIPDFAQILDVSSRKELVMYKGHGKTGFSTSRGIRSLAFSPDGSMVATGGARGDIKIWEPLTGKELFSHSEKKSIFSRFIVSLSFSPDGKRLLASTENSDKTNLWELSTGQKVGSFSEEELAGFSGVGEYIAKFSPDGQSIAIVTQTHVELWRVRPKDETTNSSWNPLGELKTIFILPLIRKPFENPYLEFSSNGRFIAASNGATVVWDLKTSRHVGRFVPSQVSWYKNLRFIEQLTFCPDEKTLAGATNKGVFLWKLKPKTGASPLNN